MIIKTPTANNGLIEAPGGYGFALRPLSPTAQFPVKVTPKGQPELVIADSGVLMLGKRFDALVITGIDGGPTIAGQWEVTVLEAPNEWRTTQRLSEGERGTLIASGNLAGVVAAAFPNGTIIKSKVDCSPFRTVLARLLLAAPAPASNVQLVLAQVNMDGTSNANGQFLTPVNSTVGFQKEVVVDPANSLNGTAGFNSQQNIYGGKVMLVDVRLNAAAGTPAVTGQWDLTGWRY